jgi:hypothetical protein
MKNSLTEPNWLRQYNSDCECEAQTINHSSAVDGSGVAAEHDNSRQQRIVKQNPAVECNQFFVNGTICLSSETNPKNSVDNFCINNGSRSLEKFTNSSDIAFSDFQLSNYYQNNSNSFAHAPTVGFEARDFCYNHEGSVFYVGMRNSKCSWYSQIDYAVLELKRTEKRELELLLNRGRLIYTKSGLFGVNYSNSYQFDDFLFKLTSAANRRGSNQIHQSHHRAPGSV